MAEYHTVASVQDVKPGQIKTFTVAGKRILIANQEGTFFATQDLCTHDGGPLGDGELVDHEIECPRHGGRFDLRTGAVIALPPVLPIKTYQVKIEDGEIKVALEQ